MSQKMEELLKKRFDVARLFAKALAGELDESEAQELEAWLRESPRHAEEWNALRREIVAGGAVFDLQREGKRMVEKRWRKFERQTRGRQWILVWVRYAAAALVPLGLAFWFLIGRQPEAPRQVAVAPILPGTYKARLILDDGRQVALDSATHVRMRELPGVEVKAENNVLVYTNGDTIVEKQVKYNTLEIPRGGEYALQLADGTRVWLNAGTSLRYPVAFSGQERRVELRGEGYFEVAKDSASPFVVSVNGVDVRVLGTSFNVSAYSDEVVTTLVEGKVLMRSQADSVVLVPDRQGVWDGKRMTVKRVDARNYALWREGVFFFEDMPLEDILDALARWYDVHVFYQNAELKMMRFSVEIKRYEHIDTILRRIAETNRVRFNVNNRTVNVYK